MIIQKYLRLATITAFILAITLLTNISRVFAHEIEQSNGTSAVLHILPNDDPAAGEPSEMDFSFGNSKSGFNLQLCDCKLVVKANGLVVSSENLLPSAPGATQTAVNKYTFPRAASYTLQIVGRPLDHQFPSFTLSYDQEVVDASALSAKAQGDRQLTAVLIAASLALFVVFATNAVRKSARYDPAPKTKLKSKKK